MARLLVLAVLIASCFAGSVLRRSPTVASPNKPTLAQSGAFSSDCTYVSSVTASSASLSSVKPSVLSCGGLPCSMYLTPASCLGLVGPIGSLGPLGAAGPLGTNLWNPTVYMSAVGDWTSWSNQINAKTSAPLSSQGPLSPQAYGVTLPKINDFGKQLQAQGLWTVLGPLGPTGPLGPLGPLGPMGIHGYAPDKAGNYKDKSGKIVRTVTYPYDASSSRTWELYEMYTSYDAATSVSNQDTSFMALANIAVGFGYIQTPQQYTFTSASDQFVTVVATPVYTTDVFSVTVYGPTGAVLAVADSSFYVNWVQFKAKAGTKYTVAVALQLTSRASFIGFDYRLLVTGGSKYFPTSDITGPHVQACGKSVRSSLSAKKPVLTTAKPPTKKN